jgi:polyadenylate-binding protein
VPSTPGPRPRPPQDGEGKAKGFGFINYETADVANAAVETLQGSEYKGKTLYAGRAMKKSEREAMLKQK